MAATNANPFDLSSVAKADVPSAGILTSQMQQVQAPDTTQSVAQATATGYDAAKAGSQGYTAAQMQSTDWNVDKNQTVQGQLSNVLDSNSSVLQKARADTAQAANSRGILNSTMAAGAGEAAVLDRALQIATPDAATYASSGQFNANAKNAASAANQNATNTAPRASGGCRRGQREHRQRRAAAGDRTPRTER